jgi:uncharacterized protein (DUF58 family)
VVVNRWWLAILLVAVGLGAWRGQPLLTLGGLFGLLIAGAETLWDRYCLTGLEYERRLSANRAVWGDDVTLFVRLANQKLLPLTWLKTEEVVPLRLPMPHARVVDDPDEHRSYLRHLLPMLPYEQVVRRYTVQCRRRGLFSFGPARLESGDLLGWTSRHLNFPQVNHLLVYPKLFELDMPTPLSRRIVGQQATRRVILTDPSRTVGVRTYQPGDPLRHVEWRASARSQEMLVRVFEPTTDLALAIFLNFRVPSLTWISDGMQELEFCISLAASTARWALDRKYPAGVFGNGTLGEEGGLRLPMSSAPDQLPRILEALALASHHPGVGIGEVMLREVPQLPFEASAILITAGFDYSVLAAIDQVRRQRPLTVFFVKTSPAEAPVIPSVPVINVQYDDYWEQQDYVQLAA